MLQIFTITLRAFVKKFYDFLMFKKVIKMYKNYKEILNTFWQLLGLNHSSSDKGPSINDVASIFAFFDPLPPPVASFKP